MANLILKRGGENKVVVVQDLFGNGQKMVITGSVGSKQETNLVTESDERLDGAVTKIENEDGSLTNDPLKLEETDWVDTGAGTSPGGGTDNGTGTVDPSDGNYVTKEQMSQFVEQFVNNKVSAASTISDAKAKKWVDANDDFNGDVPPIEDGDATNTPSGTYVTEKQMEQFVNGKVAQAATIADVNAKTWVESHDDEE